MNNTVLHIGYPKTGSTWFRENFYSNLPGLNIPDRRKIQELILAPGPFQYNSDKVKKFFGKINFNTEEIVVLCEELLLGRLRPGGIQGFLTKEIACRLKELFPYATVVVFLRNQPDIMVSAYLQYIKSGGNYSFKRFYNLNNRAKDDYRKLVLLRPEYFQYHHILDLYTTLFGRGNVKVFLYEEFLSDPHFFINNYMSSLKIQSSIDEVDFTSKNEGLRKGLMPFMKTLNAFTEKGPLNKYYVVDVPRMDVLNRFIVEKFNDLKVFGRKPTIFDFIADKDKEIIHDIFKDSNAILKNKYRIENLEKYNYPL